jgi:hypothetical protein
VTSPLSPVQLDLSVSPNGELFVGFRGKSGPDALPYLLTVIDSRFKAAGKVRQVTFDLSGIDPVANMAGRLLDLACRFAKKHRVRTSVNVPEDVYEMLSEIEPSGLPTPKDDLATWQGVTVRIVPPLEETTTFLQSNPFASPPVAYTPTPDRLVLYLEGKVRAVDGAVVSVSLFADDDEEEIVGEFHLSQFSTPDVDPGTLFEYQACVTEPGVTVVTIDPITPQFPTGNEVFEDMLKLAKEVNFEKF